MTGVQTCALPILQTSITLEQSKAKTSKSSITLADIDAIAVSKNPGLPGSLLVGLCFAKNMAYGANKNIWVREDLDLRQISSAGAFGMELGKIRRK